MKRYFLHGALALLIFSSTASATITWESLNFTAPTPTFSGGNDKTISSSGGGYTYSAEWCENASCATPVFTTADSLLKFANASIACSIDGCAQLIFQFVANVAMFPTFTSGIAAVNLSLDGTTNTGTVTGSASICFASSSFVCSANGTGDQSFSTSFIIGTAGPSGLPGESGFASVESGFTVYGEVVIDSMTNGQTLTIPNNSIDISTTLLSPEPATFGLAFAGIAVLAAVARKRSHSK